MIKFKTLDSVIDYILSKHDCNVKTVDNYYQNKNQYRRIYTCKKCNSVFDSYFSFIAVTQNNLKKSYYLNDCNELENELLNCNEVIIKNILE